MLAKIYDTKYILSNYYLQPKLDGVRLIWDGKEAISRNGKPILGVPELINSLKGLPPLDGELYSHSINFQSIVGSVRRSKNVLENTDIQYHIYDMPITNEHFFSRYTELSKLTLPDRCVRVETVFNNNIDEYYKQCLDNGYEGIMVRNQFGFYKEGRSSDLLKLKPIDEMEVIIVDIQEGEGKYKGSLGALIRETNGKQVGIGSGFSDAQRDKFYSNPPIGKTVTINYQGLTNDLIPRFPRFKGIRDYE